MNFKRILNVVGVLLLIAIVVPFVIYAVPAVVGADHSFVVLTASMTPAIAPGDVVIVADRDPGTIGEGDVITFTRGDNEVPVTHRVTTVTEGAGGLAFETKGDANSDVDSSLVPAGNVVGTVILTIPYIGYVVQFTNTPYGFVALVVGPIGLFVASELWTLYRRRSAANAAGREDSIESERAIGGAATDAETTADPGGFVVTVRTLEGSFLPLVVLAAYSGYTATVRLNELTIAVAVGSSISALAVLVLLVSSRRRTTVDATHSDPDPALGPERPAADGGVDRELAEDVERESTEAEEAGTPEEAEASEPSDDGERP